MNDMLVGGGHGLSAKRRAGGGTCHPVDAALKVIEGRGLRGRTHGELLVGSRPLVVNILADNGMDSVRLRNVACCVGGDQSFFITLDLVYRSLDFDFANTNVQQSALNPFQLVQILNVSMRTFIFTHGCHVTCGITSHALGVHPHVNAEVLTEVVLPRELLAASGTLEWSFHRVRSDVPLEVFHALVHPSTRE